MSSALEFVTAHREQFTVIRDMVDEKTLSEMQQALTGIDPHGVAQNVVASMQRINTLSQMATSDDTWAGDATTLMDVMNILAPTRMRLEDASDLCHRTSNSELADTLKQASTIVFSLQTNLLEEIKRNNQNRRPT